LELNSDVNLIDLYASKTHPAFGSVSELSYKAVKVTDSLKFEFEVLNTNKVQTINFYPRTAVPFELVYNIPMQLNVICGPFSTSLTTPEFIPNTITDEMSYFETEREYYTLNSFIS